MDGLEVVQAQGLFKCQCFGGYWILQRAGWKGTHLLVLECVQPGIEFLLLDVQIIHLVKLFGVLFRFHHQFPPHLSNLILPGKEGGKWTT